MWDIARSEDIVGDPPVVLIGALGGGIGHRTEAERHDLLMHDAPDDLFSEGIKLLGDRAEAVANAMAKIKTPLHPNCYLSPTQFIEKFEMIGLPPAERSSSAPTSNAPSKIAPVERQQRTRRRWLPW